MRSSNCAALILLSIASSGAKADLADEIPFYSSEEIDSAIEWAEGLLGGGSIALSSGDGAVRSIRFPLGNDWRL
jgi:hypothetical protein